MTTARRQTASPREFLRNAADIEPARYRTPWKAPFDDAIDIRLQAGMTILDVGSGRRPTLPRERLPHDSTYVGLDPDLGELTSAPAGAYDRVIAASAEEFVPELEATVDLAVSWQVFEHVRSLENTFENIYRYLKPGGTLISMFSGRWSAFAVINRVLPMQLAAPLVDRVMHRTAQNKPVFPAYYDSCSASALTDLTRRWSAVELEPLFRAGNYFKFSRPVLRGYMVYENAAHRRGWADAATHYLIVATR